MERVEGGDLGRWRRACLRDLDGCVLELGAGSGANISHYSDRVEGLTMVEPLAGFRKMLEARCESVGRTDVTIVEGVAESLSVPDHSLDAIVTTLVLCSVSDPERVLQECYRALRPGGRLAVIEHVRSGHFGVRCLQHFANPFQKLFAGGCRTTRDTLRYLKVAGFDCSGLQASVMRPAPLHVRDCVYGVALKP